MSDAIDRYAGRRSPPRPPETQVGTPAGVSSPVARRFRYKSSYGDSILCHTWDGVVEGTESVYVAKPWLLRPSTERDGYSYDYDNDFLRTSTKDFDSSEEVQEVVPAYVEDDEIWAVRVPSGVGSVMYLDLNVDARAWAKSA